MKEIEKYFYEVVKNVKEEDQLRLPPSEYPEPALHLDLMQLWNIGITFTIPPGAHYEESQGNTPDVQKNKSQRWD